jgi:hypothetical protein
MRRSRLRGRRTPEATVRTRVAWLRCAKVGTCKCGAGSMQSLSTMAATRPSPRRTRIGPIVPPEWRARADFSVSRVCITRWLPRALAAQCRRRASEVAHTLSSASAPSDRSCLRSGEHEPTLV